MMTTMISGATVAGVMILATPSWAQSGPVAEDAVINFSIPARNMDSALTRFADQANVKLFFPSGGVASVKSPAVMGRFTREQALQRLLAGSGYSWRMSNGDTITIEKIATTGAAEGDVVLDPLRVEADKEFERADGPVQGYVAKRSLSATKTDTPILETPQSISVVTSDEIEDQGSQTVMQAMRYTPGAFTGQVGASNRYDYVILRGLVDRSIDNIYLDGMKTMSDDSTYSSMQIDPYFVDRIDTVKGPASVLYGRSSPGGLIALSSKKPEFEQKGEVEVSYGTRQQRGVAFDVTGPVSEGGKLAYRLVGKADASDTQFDYAKEERYVIAPSLTANFTDDTRLTLMGYFQRDPEGGTHNGAPADGTLYAHNGRYISRNFFDGDPSLEKFDRTQNMVGYQFEHDFNDDLTFKQNFRFLDSDVDIDQIYQTGWDGNTNNLKRSYYGGYESLRAFTVDNQLKGNFSTGDVDHTMIGGLDYQQRRSRTNYWYTSASTINPWNPSYGTSGVTLGTPYALATKTLDQTGVYVQDQLAYENWRLSLGAREDWVETDSLNRLTEKRTGEDRSKLTTRAGVLYLFDNGIAPYFNYSESFNANLYSDANGDPLAPTEGTQYEAGVKYQPKGRDILLTASVFHIKQENVAIADPVTFVYAPAGTIKSQGIELEARAKLTDHFSMTAGYAYTDASYDAPGDVKDGKTPMQVPEHTASLWGKYSFDAGVLAGLDVGAGARYVGETWATADNTQRVPDYTIVDLSFDYDLSRVGVENADMRFNINNLFDKDYVASCNTLSNCYFGEERTMLATLRYRF
ncbi:ferrioxamine B receptor [Thalassospira mesophila]|uniref:Ferrioxamine B receptor n=2 Tax=Thalassospira mesophila TaxID=1293891 RepID=A0A1Y2L0F1_9PROT|nr:ferrioxamine B receptor [Thalassospira mesophila]